MYGRRRNFEVVAIQDLGLRGSMSGCHVSLQVTTICRSNGNPEIFRLYNAGCQHTATHQPRQIKTCPSAIRPIRVCIRFKKRGVGAVQVQLDFFWLHVPQFIILLTLVLST